MSAYVIISLLVQSRYKMTASDFFFYLHTDAGKEKKYD